MGVSGDVQEVANAAVDSVQELANSVFDLGEEALGTVFQAAASISKLLGEIVEKAGSAAGK